MTYWIAATSQILNGNDGYILLDGDGVLVTEVTTLAGIGDEFSGIVGLGDRHRIDVQGTVAGAYAVELTGFNCAVNVAEGGALFGSFAGVYMGADYSVEVFNDGTISGYYGINGQDYVELTNTGRVSAEDAGVFAASGIILNSGTISAHRGLVFNGTFGAEITNSGTLIGRDYAVQMFSVNAHDVVVNTGLIIGDIALGDGNDRFDGEGGRIKGLVDLGSGNDTFTGGDFADRVLGGAGADEIDGAGGNDVFGVLAGDGGDTYDGGAGLDSYDASAVSSGVVVNLTTGIARVGSDVDLLSGIERVIGGALNDLIDGDAAANRLTGRDGRDTLSGAAGQDTLIGGDGADLLSGGDDNDVLKGGVGADRIFAGSGDDVIIGGYDIDTLNGGAGADRFVFTDSTDFLRFSLATAERITDFTQGSDKIDLSGLDPNAGLAGDQAFSFIGTAAVTAVGQLSYKIVGGNTFVSIGFITSAPFEILQLDGALTLTAADFIL